MNKSVNTLVGLATIVCAALSTMSVARAQDLSGIKCVVNGDKTASPDASVEYRDGIVYVCCPSCVEKFESDPAAYVTKSNHQLVLTGQYEQSKCPISGSQVDPHFTANIAGTEVSFCCPKCLQKVKDTAEMADRAELVFGDDAFEKAFVKVDVQSVADSTKEFNLSKAHCPLQSDHKVSAMHSVDYLQGKVFFCCQKCADAFSDSPEKYAAAANRQLAATEQYVQIECPLVGGPLSDEHAAMIDGVPIKLCCEKCVAAIKAAKTEKQKNELIFEPKRFAKSFKLAPINSKVNSETQAPAEMRLR